MKRQRKKGQGSPTATERFVQNALIDIVRAKLVALGDFGHLHVRRTDEYLLIEQPGPPEDPEDRHPVLRLTPIGGFRFGLSLHNSSGRWEMLPVSGLLADVLTDAVRMLGPWLAADPY